MVHQQLARRGIRDARVLQVLERLPRERFIPDERRGEAYADRALAIECGQTISQPYMVARMSELLEIVPGARVLEIGTGSGYQTAVLASLEADVFTIERHATLQFEARRRLESLGFDRVHYRVADGTLGWATRAPFRAILMTAGVPDAPPPLVAQLGLDGLLVAPIGGEDEQTLVRVRRSLIGAIREDYFRCRFVKALGAAGWSA
jgi:protein-L-isoaspartate(D-aspartate) O-methyltransferase